MRRALTISALARATQVPAKTLRYWEQFGLLPRAARTHTGYRIFGPEAVRYVEFVRKSRSVGLTLKEMKHLLELAESGRNPCPQVAEWLDRKAAAVEQQIRGLRELQRRLRRIRLSWSGPELAVCGRDSELCCLIEGLPICTSKEKNNAPTRNHSVGNSAARRR